MDIKKSGILSTFKSLFVFIGPIFGVVLGTAIFLVGTGTTSDSQESIRSPEFLIWVFLNDSLFALYPLLIFWLWKDLSQLKEYLLKNKLEVVLFIIIVTALYFFPFVIAALVLELETPPLESIRLRIFLIEFIGFVIGALPMSLGIWLVYLAGRDWIGNTKLSGEAVDDYKRYRNNLQQFLTGLGVLLSLAVLASAAARQAAVDPVKVMEGRYPTLLLLFGAYYTALIATVYFPAYGILTSVGHNILNGAFSLPPLDSESWANTYSKRKLLEEMLELKVTGMQRFVATITLLAPFVSSIFSLLLQR
jgi:hypothetical protein